MLDISHTKPGETLVSPASIGAISNIHEALIALAMTDLPFSSTKAIINREDQGLTITAKQPLLVIYQSLQTSPDTQAGSLVVAQHIFRVGERKRLEAGKWVDAFIEQDLVAHVPYTTEVVVSNPTSEAQHVHILNCLPEGAIPLSNAQANDASLASIPAYRTQVLNVSFYFPQAGTITMPGTQVAIDDKIVAWAPSRELSVHGEAPAEDEHSWQWISQHAKEDRVFNWLREENLHTFPVDRIAWRMHDKDFYTTCLSILSERQFYSPILWAYSFKHGDVKRMGEYLSQREDFLHRCGLYLESPLVDSEPVKRIGYEHLEFKPLINARAHQLSNRPWIGNKTLAQQYEALLQRLSHQPQLSANDRLEVLYFLLLQDRISDSINWFTRIDGNEVSAPIPYDYAKAWLALAQGKPAEAQHIVDKHSDMQHPLWSQRFLIMRQQLEEIAGATPGDHIEADPQHHRQAQLEANKRREGMLNMSIHDGKPMLSWKGHEKVELRYYYMDIELLFSRNPFKHSGDHVTQAAIIAPNLSEVLNLPNPNKQLEINIPTEAQQRNLIIEAIAGGQRSTITVLAHNMLVDVRPSFGQLRVINKSQPADKLHTVYVKVYREMKNGRIEFHKNGYTDLRGRFDYASVNDVKSGHIKRFALLVLSDEHGAQIKEVSPPAQ